MGPASEPVPTDIVVSDWSQLRGGLKYHESLDRELPDAQRTNAEFDGTRDQSE
jgi:hypothetical protein